MNCRVFERRLEAELFRVGCGTLAPGASPPLSDDLRAHAAHCPSCRQLERDWQRLQQQMTTAGLSEPPDDFVEQVMARLRAARLDEPRAQPVRRALSGRLRAVTAAVGCLAALVLITVRLTAPREAALTPPPQSTMDLPETLRGTGSAYLALVRDVADLIPIADLAPDALLTPDADPDGLLGPPLGRAVRDSTGAVTNAGKGITTGLRPIAQSAVRAFDFLWTDLAQTPRKPST